MENYSFVVLSLYISNSVKGVNSLRCIAYFSSDSTNQVNMVNIPA